MDLRTSKLLAVFLAVSIFNSVQADENGIVVTPQGIEINGGKSADYIFTCERNNFIRRIEVKYETNDKLPCAVNYYKHDETPNKPETLWTASETAGFCEEKAEEFVAKLTSWGWACANN